MPTRRHAWTPAPLSAPPGPDRVFFKPESQSCRGSGRAPPPERQRSCRRCRCRHPRRADATGAGRSRKSPPHGGWRRASSSTGCAWPRFLVRAAMHAEGADRGPAQADVRAAPALQPAKNEDPSPSPWPASRALRGPACPRTRPACRDAKTDRAGGKRADGRVSQGRCPPPARPPRRGTCAARPGWAAPTAVRAAKFGGQIRLAARRRTA